MRIDQLEICRAAIGADYLVVAGDQLVDVAIDALLAEALATFVALTWFNEHIFAENAVEERVVLGCCHSHTVGASLAGFVNLAACECGLALQDHGTGLIPRSLITRHILRLGLVLGDGDLIRLALGAVL